MNTCLKHGIFIPYSSTFMTYTCPEISVLKLCLMIIKYIRYLWTLLPCDLKVSFLSFLCWWNVT